MKQRRRKSLEEIFAAAELREFFRPTAAQRHKARRVRLQSVGAYVAFILSNEFGRRPEGMPGPTVTASQTTSGQPLIKIAYPDGAVFHCTIARALRT